ncbi:MAG: type II secretion system F family protein [Pseudomonadota bacterium]
MALEKEQSSIFLWEGIDRSNRPVKGEMRATNDKQVSIALKRQGVRVNSIKKRKLPKAGTISDKDVAMFTRQLATMLKSGVPLLQSFDIVAKGHSNPAMSRLLFDIKGDVEQGSSLNQAFRKHPVYFDRLYCNLIAAGESAGILDTILDRLAVYREKILAIKSKIKAALFYPTAVIAVAIIVVAVIMIWVVPAFKDVFSSFGAELPLPTKIVIAMSDTFVAYWYYIFGAMAGGVAFIIYSWKRSPQMQMFFDRVILHVPIIGEIIQQAVIARWTRTLATMFAAGVPLVESLDSVAGACGNQVYSNATKRVQTDISTGVSLAYAMGQVNVFPNMVLQMTAIGEESGSLDNMLSKVADFYEREVDDKVAALSSLLEPIIIVFLGVVIGGLVVAMYLPIFKLGQVV